MKLKEYWPAWKAARRIKRLPLAELVQASNDPLPVVVTLTSIPSRLDVLPFTIRSVLAQSKKPEKIILWLHHDLKSQVPQRLAELQGEVFEIRYADLTCSHRKLIYSLAEFPNKVLVTCDDDLIYEQDWLERLYNDHLKYPQDVIAHECRRIQCDSDGAVLPYKSWKTVTESGVQEDCLLPIGYGGVLYPPKCLLPETTNVELFLALTPRADDLWFKAMSYLNGTSVRRSSHPVAKPQPIFGSQKISLKKTNVDEDGNRKQWQLLREHYPALQLLGAVQSKHE